MAQAHPSVSFVGVGLMGGVIATRMIDAHFPVVCWNRTAAKCNPLAEKGAKVTATAAECINASPVVVLMVSTADVCDELLFNSTGAQLNGKCIINMSTVGADDSKKLAAKLQQHGASLLEVPVMGTPASTKLGKMQLLVGGPAALVDQWTPVLMAMVDTNAGGALRRIGTEYGQAAVFKLAVNNMVGTLMGAFGTSLAMIDKAGLDTNMFMDALKGATFWAPYYQFKYAPASTRTYQPASFTAGMLRKDTRLIAAVCKELGVGDAVVQTMLQLLNTTCDQGHADSDFAAVYEVINPKKQ